MKIEFLNRIETEKGSVVKVVFTVPVGHSEVFALEKGKSYEVKPYEAKLPGVSPSPKEMLIEAQRLISEASGHIKEDDEPVLEFPCDKHGDKCATCASWIRGDMDIGIPKGQCQGIDSPHFGEITPIYHWCSYWTGRKEVIAQEEGK